MIDFSKFYNDIEFTAALFYNGFLTDDSVYSIADRLTNAENNEILIDVLVSGNKEGNLKKFEKYINSKNIGIMNAKIFLIKKIFQYILKNEIDLSDGIRFINFEVIDRKKTNKYLGDDVGIEQILGNFWAIEDGDVTESDKVNELKNEITKEMQEYIKKN